MEYAACTHAGKIRSNNEDCIYLPAEGGSPQVVIVADGMGGHNAGEVASSLAVKTLCEYFNGRAVESIEDTNIRESLVKANENVLRESYTNVEYIGMGTTLTLAVLQDDALIVGHVGDSRAYLWNNKGLRLITRDHSFVQELIDNGLITENEALVHPRRNIITRAIGISSNLEIDIIHTAWQKNDMLLLCSDGLSQHVMFNEINEILSDRSDLNKKADMLFSKAMDKGGTDNISVILTKNS
jgi:protein phosphatase